MQALLRALLRRCVALHPDHANMSVCKNIALARFRARKIFLEARNEFESLESQASARFADENSVMIAETHTSYQEYFTKIQSRVLAAKQQEKQMRTAYEKACEIVASKCGNETEFNDVEFAIRDRAHNTLEENAYFINGIPQKDLDGLAKTVQNDAILATDANNMRKLVMDNLRIQKNLQDRLKAEWSVVKTAQNIVFDTAKWAHARMRSTQGEPLKIDNKIVPTSEVRRATFAAILFEHNPLKCATLSQSIVDNLLNIKLSPKAG